MSETQVFDIEHWPIEDLKEYPLNAKLHPEKQIKQLARSIARLGWSQPIIVDLDGVIIAGHGRRLAALHLGLKKVPVICRRDLSRDEANALRLADNKMASVDYDSDLLNESLGELSAEMFEESGYEGLEFEKVTEMSEMEMDAGVITDDVNGDVSLQAQNNEEMARQMDEATHGLVKVFGFNKVTTDQARKLKIAMTGVEHQTQQKGADALVAFFEDHGY